MVSDKQKHALLTLIGLDVENLFKRISRKKEDYLMILNFRRTREHFVDIFQSKYYQMNISELKELEESTIYALDQFYQEVGELKWYLLYTEDLPAMIDDHTDGEIKRIKRFFDEAMKSISLELGQEGPFSRPAETQGPPPIDFRD